MLDGQDTDDDKLAWRVEAELKLRLDELRRTEGAAAAALAAQLETARVRCLAWQRVSQTSACSPGAERPQGMFEWCSISLMHIVPVLVQISCTGSYCLARCLSKTAS